MNEEAGDQREHRPADPDRRRLPDPQARSGACQRSTGRAKHIVEIARLN